MGVFMRGGPGNVCVVHVMTTDQVTTRHDDVRALCTSHSTSMTARAPNPKHVHCALQRASSVAGLRGFRV